MVSTSGLYNAEHPLKLIWDTSFLYLKKRGTLNHIFVKIKQKMTTAVTKTLY
jgi:hypothetical protein